MTFAPHDTTEKNLMALSPDEFPPERIAEALSKLPRFLGATKTPWSVADHSVVVARRLLESDCVVSARWGLLHDAAEIFIGDIPTPLKHRLTYLPPGNGQVPWNLTDVENSMLEVVAARYGLPWPMPACVVDADGRQLASEIQYFFSERDPARYAGGYFPWDKSRVPWSPWWLHDVEVGSPRAAARRWMACYRELFDETVKPADDRTPDGDADDCRPFKREYYQEPPKPNG